MLESSFGINFFMKTPRNKTNLRLVYLRITVDGIPKETSIKRKWDPNRWQQKSERATGTKEDARTINYYLDTLTLKIKQFAAELVKKAASKEKELFIINGATHMDLYDRPLYVTKAVDKLKIFFDKNLENSEHGK